MCRSFDMQAKKLLIVFFLLFRVASAQPITGMWVGRIVDDAEYLQINVVEVGDKLCGYTGDYVLDNPASFCKAYFTGSYIKAKDQWFLNGTDFIENSGSHVLMQLLITVSKENGKWVMDGYCRAKPDFPFSNNPLSVIRLTKVADEPKTMTERMKNCVEDIRPRKKQPATVPTVKPKPVPPQNSNPKPLPKIKGNVPEGTPEIPADTVKPVTIVPKNVIPALPLPIKTAGRMNKEIRTITVHQKKITLYVYDNAEVDGDSISIFYNGRLLMNHMRLTEKPIKVDLDLDENTSLHSLVIFAENLGSIPPNTALIIFTDADGKRYELFSRSDLSENAELVFKYEP